MMSFLINAVIVLLTAALMEVVATLTHRYILHGVGWGWHRTHHERHDDVLEKNDLYAVILAILAVGLMLAGHFEHWWLYWVGSGMSLYGVLYFLVHDGLSHQRWPFRYVPKHGYLKRLVQAHRLHHASPSRTDGVSYGFLYAPPVARLTMQLRRKSQLPREGDRRARPQILARSRGQRSASR